MALSIGTAPSGSAAPNPDPLATLKPLHPRLLATDADWAQLRARRETDPELNRVITRIEADGKALLDEPPLVYRKEGRRLLDVSRQALQRVLTWSFNYRLSGDPIYAERTRRELLNLAAFPDWNPTHFLDTAEMTAAFAIGYDWTYDRLDATNRETIKRAIIEKGLELGMNSGASYNSWHRSANNWNQVCFGGLTLGALAIADEEPATARAFLKLARQGISAGLRPYAPDGVYPEGPGYWGYGTSYQVLMIAALQSALGTAWKLESSPGFLSSAAAQLELTGPSGNAFNFSDSTERWQLQPATFWFARRLHQPELLRFEGEDLTEALARPVQVERSNHENRLFPLIALWWTDPPALNIGPKLPLTWQGNGPNPVGVFRTSWTDTNAVFVAFKGGAASVSHGHMDAGSFVLEADGVRWAVDLGRQDYFSLESKGIDLWGMGQNSERWRVFRLNNHSHNTLTIGGQLHRVEGAARFLDFRGGNRPRATIDLSPVFAGQATRVTRRFRLEPDHTVVIRDELSGVTPGTKIRWAMVTRAAVQIAGTNATLTQDGKSLNAVLSTSSPADFAVIPADPPVDNFNAPNPNVRILVTHVTAPESGKMTIEVAFHPGTTLSIR